MLSFLLGGVEEAGSSWWAGLATGVLAWVFMRSKKEKLRSWAVMGPRTEQGGLRESPYETVGKVGMFPAQAGMSRP